VRAILNRQEVGKSVINLTAAVCFRSFGAPRGQQRAKSSWATTYLSSQGHAMLWPRKNASGSIFPIGADWLTSKSRSAAWG